MIYLDQAPCGFLSVSDDGTILTVNQTLLRWLGYQAEEVCGQHLNRLLPVPSRMFYQLYVLPLIGLEGDLEEIYLPLQSKGGDPVPMLLNVGRRMRNGSPVHDHIFVQMRRRSEYEQAILTSKREAEEAYQAAEEAKAQLEVLRSTLESKQQELLEVNQRLAVLATTDELTGLKNRRTFQELLTRMIELFGKAGSPPVSLLLIDIDHFKQINDTNGHPAGDSVLQGVAQVLEANSRETDVVARYGGEEFAMILPKTDGACALHVAERLRRAVETARWEVGAVTISIGVATLHPGEDGNSLLQRADQGLYASKQAGRNRVTEVSALP